MDYRVTTWNTETQTTETHRVSAPNIQAAIHAVEGPVTDVAPWDAPHVDNPDAVAIARSMTAKAARA